MTSHCGFRSPLHKGPIDRCVYASRMKIPLSALDIMVAERERTAAELLDTTSRAVARLDDLG